ncbi:MAG: hypothetical protein C4341_07805 [Armatimonadota bacterium]
MGIGPEPGMDPRQRRALIRLFVAIGIVTLLLGLSGVIARFLMDYWWYKEDVGATIIFFRPLLLRPLFFLVAFIGAFTVVYLVGRAALNTRAVRGVLDTPIFDHPYYHVLARGHGWFLKMLRLVALFFGLLFGMVSSGHWKTCLLYVNAEPFGKTDPIFGLDYSFFVFRLPLIEWIVGTVIALTIISALLLAVVHFGIAGLAVVARVHLRDPAPRKHFTIVGAVFLFALGVQIYVSRYGSVITPGPRITGASYADLQAVGAKAIAAWVLWLSAAAALLTIGKQYAGLIAGAVVSGVVYIVGVAIWPQVVQTYTVQPNELQMETPYIVHAIEATRWAYALDKIDVREDFPATVRPSPEEIAKSEQTLRNMRLWDPFILRSSVQQLQGLRDYYVFHDIDVDRYEIDGVQRMLMVGARDLVVHPNDTQRSNWQSLHLIYTHGNGIVACPVNEAGPSGKPTFFLKDLPPAGRPELEIAQPRIYFSDADLSRYVMVRTRQEEFDRPGRTSGEDVFHRWEGEKGVSIASPFRRFMASLYFGEYDILLTRAVGDQSVILFNRAIRERAEKLFPYLVWDNDPYIAIVDKRLTWIMDGYTTTDSIPYSSHTSMRGLMFNYIRNSVKLTIDAYTGEWKAYVMDDDCPILKTWAKVYPGLLTPKAEAPQSLIKHFRYPEDLFTAQSHQLALYHVTDPQVFFQRNDAWEVPTVDGSAEQTGSRRMVPYYVQMRLPDEERDSFMLILPFTPLNRPNMIGWLAAHCDPHSYGDMVLYVFPEDRSINGPAQQNAMFNQDSKLAQMITLLDQRGSQLQHGNLLVVPIGGSVMYVKTFFLVASGGQMIPELKLVVLAFSDKIVFADSYPRALEMLLGERPKVDVGTVLPSDEPGGTPLQGVAESELARRALQILREAQTAQQRGDWATYGEALRRLEKVLKQASGEASTAAKAQAEG